MWSRVSLTTDGSFQNRNWIIFSRNFTGQSSRGAAIPAGRDFGLAIVQQIAELHHGQVRVKSDLQGTVFEVELPVGMPKGKKEDEKR